MSVSIFDSLTHKTRSQGVMQPFGTKQPASSTQLDVFTTLADKVQVSWPQGTSLVAWF